MGLVPGIGYVVRVVAILGHPEGRPPLLSSLLRVELFRVAILGPPGKRPPHQPALAFGDERVAVAILGPPKGDRHGSRCQRPRT